MSYELRATSYEMVQSLRFKVEVPAALNTALQLKSPADVEILNRNILIENEEDIDWFGDVLCLPGDYGGTDMEACE